MAALCLADGPEDLRARLDRTIVARRRDGSPVTARDLGATGPMLALLRDALLPNLVRTAEGVPALVHGGPFANIAHGCNSVLATRMALHLADWAITEAGFGFDLGAEKFFDIKCAQAGLDTAAVVLVATVRALRHHGGGSVEAGLPNLAKHVENIGCFGEVPVVALNRFADDRPEDVAVVERWCAGRGVPFAVSDHFARGGDGAVDLARALVAHAEKVSRPYRPLYAPEVAPIDKVRTVARAMYGARDVVVTPAAAKDLDEVERLGFARLPVCIAKTPASLSDDPRLRGRPEGFDVTVRAVRINAAAGFLVVLTGDVLRMPGMPAHPRALDLDLVRGRIVGLE